MGQLDGSYSNQAGDKLAIESDDAQGRITGVLYQKSSGLKLDINGNDHFSGGSRDRTVFAFWAHHNDKTVYQSWAGHTDRISRFLNCSGVEATEGGNTWLPGPFQR